MQPAWSASLVARVNGTPGMWNLMTKAAAAKMRYNTPVMSTCGKNSSNDQGGLTGRFRNTG